MIEEYDEDGELFALIEQVKADKKALKPAIKAGDQKAIERKAELNKLLYRYQLDRNQLARGIKRGHLVISLENAIKIKQSNAPISEIAQELNIPFSAVKLVKSVGQR